MSMVMRVNAVWGATSASWASRHGQVTSVGRGMRWVAAWHGSLWSATLNRGVSTSWRARR